MYKQHEHVSMFECLSRARIYVSVYTAYPPYLKCIVPSARAIPSAGFAPCVLVLGLGTTKSPGSGNVDMLYERHTRPAT